VRFGLPVDEDRRQNVNSDDPSGTPSSSLDTDAEPCASFPVERGDIAEF
jgi:hypothetical protein